jgi:uncharacterized protein YukE
MHSDTDVRSVSCKKNTDRRIILIKQFSQSSTKGGLSLDIGDLAKRFPLIQQQQQATTQVMDTIKSYVPMVQASWIGGDADAFAADVARKIIPAITQLIAAMAGINLNLVSATEIVDKADAECKSMVADLASTFDGII